MSTALTSLRSSSHELQVAVDLLQHRIDDQRLTTLSAGEKIGAGSGRAVQKLAEDAGAPHSDVQLTKLRGFYGLGLQCTIQFLAPSFRSGMSAIWSLRGEKQT